MNIIQTYFDVTYPLPDQGEVIRLWRDSWTRRGWEPRILNPRTFHASPERKEFLRLAYEMAFDPFDYYRIARLLALAAVDGGWVCDYDVINYSLMPPSGEIGRRSVFLGADCALFYLAPGHAQQIVEEFLDKPNWDIERLYARLSPAIFDPTGGDCVRYGTVGWETARTVHFGRADVAIAHGENVKRHEVINSCCRR